VPGPLFDFGLHMFHNSKLMIKEGNGPFFYLPKVCHEPREDLFITRFSLFFSLNSWKKVQSSFCTKPTFEIILTVSQCLVVKIVLVNLSNKIFTYQSSSLFGNSQLL